MKDSVNQAIAVEADYRTVRPARLWSCFLYLGGLALLMLAVDRLIAWPVTKVLMSSWIGLSLALVLITIAGLVVWRQRQVLYRSLTSSRFCVALLTFIVASIALGTVIIQGSHPKQFARHYGPSWSFGLLGLGFDDIFHSLWFGGLLVILAISLILVAVKKGNRRPHRWGHVLVHLGIVLIVLGGLVGYFWGFKGIINLHEGQTADSAVAMKWGMPVGERRNLGFSIRLDDFEIEQYAPEYRFYMYERSTGSHQALQSFGTKRASEWVSLGVEDFEFRLVQSYPDFYMQVELEEAPPGQGLPGLQIETGKGKKSTRLPLMAGVSGRDTTNFAPKGPWLRFVWDPPSEQELSSFWTTQAKDPAYELPQKTILVVGKNREVWELDRNKVFHRTSLLNTTEGSIPGMQHTRFRIIDSAREVRTPATRSNTWQNPVAMIEVRRAAGPPRTFFLFANGKPLLLPDERTVLSFGRKPDGVKAYRSHLAVLGGGNKVFEKTIEVNDPLSYGGYRLYQFDYRREDPSYSGILAVRDPGLPWVWAGLVMICVGVVYIYYVAPRILRMNLSKGS